MRILTVCIGNICRSPMAEFFLREAFSSSSVVEEPEGRLEATVSSAGTYGGHEGEPINRQAGAQLIERGIDPSAFRARRLRKEHVDEADLILAATTDVRSEILSRYPGAIKKTFTMLEFAALVSQPSLVEQRAERASVETSQLIAAATTSRASARGPFDIDDPYGLSDEVFADTADLIADAAKRIATAFR